ncbi:hypothetical protein GCM10025883_35800 [Mobilicoccus caccae]|uniref:Uncharacterized protein n=1 Tax=Mobilicoccus caccae TaxID=1859295 RepID=A0ABQ6IVZ7_9MICO|nr:hypothetical protein GCM10025883_35800 [Mobilicoccus caccae]
MRGDQHAVGGDVHVGLQMNDAEGPRLAKGGQGVLAADVAGHECAAPVCEHMGRRSEGVAHGFSMRHAAVNDSAQRLVQRSV